MTAIIVLLSVISFVLVYTYLMLKNALEFLANRLIDINTNLKKITEVLESLSKTK
jgi:hypothetical protein